MVRSFEPLDAEARQIVASVTGLCERDVLDHLIAYVVSGRSDEISSGERRFQLRHRLIWVGAVRELDASTRSGDSPPPSLDTSAGGAKNFSLPFGGKVYNR